VHWQLGWAHLFVSVMRESSRGGTIALAGFRERDARAKRDDYHGDRYSCVYAFAAAFRLAAHRFFCAWLIFFLAAADIRRRRFGDFPRGRFGVSIIAGRGTPALPNSSDPIAVRIPSSCAARWRSCFLSSAMMRRNVGILFLSRKNYLRTSIVANTKHMAVNMATNRTWCHCHH
jgi:hypothetical protein